MERILAAASAALGERLDHPADLGGSTRSQVLRCERAGGGTAPSLADLLLGDSPQAAEEGLLTWASTCGRLAVSAADRRAEWERSYTAYAQPGARPGYLDRARATCRAYARRCGPGWTRPPDGMSPTSRIIRVSRWGRRAGDQWRRDAR
ncbi:hypothetical protein GCM10009850_037740 [Nonomuraea monospora]|uniref:Uncharacterized protein n=1 Tax=Nonomuraea monospora TaxID=568818 RepID=A0ABN3CG04_9ACTN